MGIAVSISLTAIQSSLRERRQIAYELQMEQTRWLADAGLSRGIDRIRSTDDYDDQLWDVQPVLNDRYIANVQISVEVIDESTGVVQLVATATLTTNDPRRFETRHTARLTVRENDVSRNEQP
jgi:hypothetical protein